MTRFAHRFAQLAAAVLMLAPGATALGADYYVSPAGDDGQPGTSAEPWQSLQHAADSIGPGDTVHVGAGTYEEHLRIEVTGTASEPVVFQAEPGEEVVVEGQNVTLPGWGGLVWVRSSSYVTVSGFVVQHAGPGETNAGIFVTDSDHVTIEENRTYDTVSSGIGVWGSEQVTVRNNEIELACNDGSQECLTIADTDGFEVANNEVHHGGPGTRGGEGMDLKDGARNGRAWGNRVHHINRVGIYVDAWDEHSHHIDVFANTVWACDANGFAVANENGGLLEAVRVFDNVAYDNRIGLTVAAWGVDGASHDMDDIQILNNTFVRNGDTWGGGILVESSVASNVVIRNNLLSQNVSFQIELDQSPPGIAVDHNLIDGFRDETGEVRGDDYVEGDPLFVDGAAADFHLTEGSPAIDAASADLAPDRDFDDYVRPAGAGYDMGAFEYGASPAGGAGGAAGSGGAGTAGTGGSAGAPVGGSAGAALAAGDSDDAGGCGCRLAAPPRSKLGAFGVLAALALARRRRRCARARPDLR